MKMFALLLVAVLMNSASGETERVVETNAELGDRPFDQNPLPAKQREGTIRVVGEFIQQEKLLSIVRGRRIHYTYLATYRVVPSDDSKLEVETLVFTVPDSVPDPRSGLVSKKLQWPFQAGKQIFYLKRDANCTWRPYFEVVAHHALEKQTG